MNIEEDSLESLSATYTHALASVIDTHNIDRQVAIRANDFLNALHTSPRGIEVMLCLLRNFTQITSVPDLEHFLFAILSSLVRCFQNSKARSTGGYEHKWHQEMKKCKEYIDVELFGAPEGSPGQIVLQLILKSSFVCAKFQQAIGQLYVPFKPEEWSHLNNFILQCYGNSGATPPVPLVSFLSGTLTELCVNLNNDRSSSCFVQKKIDKGGRINRVKDIAEIVKLVVLDRGKSPDTSREAAVAYAGVTKLFEEFVSLLACIQMPQMLETPVQFSFELFVSPKILSHPSSLLAATESFHNIVQNICSIKIRREYFYQHMSHRFHEQIIREIIYVVKMLTTTTINSISEWDDSDLLTVIDRLVSALSIVVEKCGQIDDWYAEVNVLYITLLMLHIPHQQTFIKAQGLFTTLINQIGTPAKKGGEVKPLSPQIITFFQVAFKFILYRIIRVTDFEAGNSSFLDRAILELLMTNVNEYLALSNCRSLSSITSWKDCIVQATQATEDSDEDEKNLLATYACTIRSTFKTLIAAIVKAEGIVWETFSHVCISVVNEWFDNAYFKQSLNHNYPIPAGTSIKVKGFISPCYCLIDAVGILQLALSEINKPSSVALGQQIMTGLFTAPLTWVDSNVTVTDQKAHINLAALKPQVLGSHWHWIEWRRLEILKQCPNLATNIRGSILLEFLIKRIQLEVPSDWLAFFPVGDCDGEQEDVFYLTRRRGYQTIARVFSYALTNNDATVGPEVEGTINLLVNKLRGGERSIDSSEQHLITETIISLTSAMGNCATSKAALEGVILQLFGNCRSSLEIINADYKRLIDFMLTEDIKSCTERRRQLCRELMSLDTIATSLIFPSTFEACVQGGFITTPTPAEQMVMNNQLIEHYPLTLDSCKAYENLKIFLNAPQDLFAEALLPLLINLIDRIVETYATQCRPGSPCSCGYPLRCRALQTASEDDINLVYCATKRSQSVDEIYKRAGITNLADPTQQVVQAAQTNLKALIQAVFKLTSNVLKICSSLALYKNSAGGESASRNCLQIFEQLQTVYICKWLNTPQCPAIITSNIVSKIINQGVLFAVNGSGLPSTTSEILPVIPDPFVVVLPTPDTISFHAYQADVFQSKVAGVLVDCAIKTWDQSCVITRTEPLFLGELRRLQASQIINDISQLFNSFFNVSQAVSGKNNADDVEIDIGGTKLMARLSKCTMISLRAMTHVHLLKEIYNRLESIETLVTQIIRFMSIPMAETLSVSHSCIRNYARLAWKRVGYAIAGQDKKQLKRFLDGHSRILKGAYDAILRYALIIKSPYPICDDPFACDIIVDPELMKHFGGFPASLIHHIYNGKSSSSGSLLFRIVKVSVDNRNEILWSAEDAMSLYAWCISTLYDILKAALQLFCIRCTFIILHKTAGYQLNNAELLSSVDHDPSFKSLVLLMADEKQFGFTLEGASLVEWVTSLNDQKDNRQIRQDMKQFFLGNLEKVSPPPSSIHSPSL